MIIREDRAFDTAEQHETEKSPIFILTYNGPKLLQSSKPVVGSKLGGRTFDQQTSGKKADRDSHLCPTWWKCDTWVFLGREFLIYREVPSSAYLQKASVAVDVDWQRPSRDSLEVMCHSAYPPKTPTARRRTTSPGSTQLPLIRRYDIGERSPGRREKGVRPSQKSSRITGLPDSQEVITKT